MCLTQDKYDLLLLLLFLGPLKLYGLKGYEVCKVTELKIEHPG